MTSKDLLFSIAAMVFATQAGIVLLLVVRNAWVERSLARRANRSRLLATMLNDLGAGTSPHVRAELARRPMQRDLRALEHWLDLVVERGEDPGWLPVEEYERTGLVQRYLDELQTAKSWTRRAAAAEILGWTRSPRAVPQLVTTALDVVREPDSVRAVALRSLARIRHPDAVSPLVASLGTTETWFAPTAAAVLARIGAPAVEPLRRELENLEKPIAARRWAAAILGDIADRQALGALHAALGDIDPELRARAAKALGKIRDATSIAPLHERLLTDPSPFVRTSVAKALGRLPTRETIDFLTQSLSDPEWWVRLRAVESLSNLGSPAIDTLRGALHDRDPIVAREAARGLEQLGVVGESIEALGEDDYSPESTEFLIQVGRAGSLDALFDALARPEPRLVLEVVRILGRVGNSAAGVPLAALLARAEDDALRARVVDALVKVGAKGHVREILPHLDSPHRWLRRMSLEYLSRFASPRDLDPVRTRISAPEPFQRSAALRLVRRVRPAGLADEEVEACLVDEHAEVRAEAAALVASWGRSDLLVKHAIALDEDRVVRQAVRALQPGKGTSALRFALQAYMRLGDRDLDLVASVIQVVARDHPSETIVLLASAITDPGARWALATCALSLPTALPVSLGGLAEDEDPRIRSAVLPALLFHEAESRASRERVIAATRDRSTLVVRSAVRALALVPDPAIDGHFEAVLRRAPDPRVVADVILALALRRRLEAKHLERVEAVLEDPRVRLASIVGRTYQGDPGALRSWLEILRDSKDRDLLTRWRSEEHPLLAVLFHLARDPRSPLETRLLTAESAHDAEMRLIEELESNPAEDVRTLAAEGLQSLRSRKADGVLLSACLRDPSPRVRSAALGYLVERGGLLQRLGLLESALKDPEESVRVAAARQTSSLETAVAVPILVRHLGASRSRFFDAVADALADRARTEAPSVFRAILEQPESPRLYLGLVAVLRRLPGSPPSDVLERLVRHRWAEVRGAALSRLGTRAGEDAGRLALAAASDPSADVRFPAARLLGSREVSFAGLEAERESSILRLLADPSVRVRHRAALVAGAIGLTSARPALRRLARESEPRVARAALRALARLDRNAHSAVNA